MNTASFSPTRGPILVQAQVSGPQRSTNLRLLLDTGATRTTIKRSSLIHLGFDPERDGEPGKVITGSRMESVRIITLTRLGALGQNRVGFRVAAHLIPPEANIDGLLGLDFFQDHILTLDFRTGTLTLV